MNDDTPKRRKKHNPDRVGKSFFQPSPVDGEEVTLKGTVRADTFTIDATQGHGTIHINGGKSNDTLRIIGGVLKSMHVDGDDSQFLFETPQGLLRIDAKNIEKREYPYNPRSF